MRRISTKGGQVLVGLVMALPLLIVLHEFLLFAVASLLSGLNDAHPLGLFARSLSISPVYTELAIKTLSGIEPRGIALPVIAGFLLHQWSPSFFLDPALVAPGAFASAIIDSRSTILSVFVTRALVEMALLALGALLVRAGWQRPALREGLQESRGARDLLYVGLGLFIQAQAVWAIFNLTLGADFAGFQQMGIGVAVSIAFRPNPQQYKWAMDEALPVVIPFLMVGAALAAAGLLGQLADRLVRVVAQFTSRPACPAPSIPLTRHGALLAGALIITALFPWSQNYFGLAKMNTLSRSPVQGVYVEATAIRAVQGLSPADMATPTAYAAETPTVTPAPAESEQEPRVIANLVPDQKPSNRIMPTATEVASVPTVQTPMGPTKVGVRRTEQGLILTVNGQPRIMTGMNYNVNYTLLPEDVKRARHRRDFEIMRAAGVNAVIGWGVYDEATLELAQEFGIGVVMPFELDAQGPYENQNYREQVKKDFRAYVRRFKDFPAVWAWNPGGDELLHRMDTDQHRTTDKLQAAADFLVELSALAFSLDPNHVSIIKEPRDWYIPHLDVAIKKMRAQPQQPDPSNFLVFGLNVYGSPDDVAEAVRAAKRNAERRLGVPLVVGEFAPFGMDRKDRGAEYAMIWDDVSRFSPNGGFAYVFGPDQPNPKAPNPYDPLRLLVNEFSLVSNEGTPVDNALGALATKYLQVHHPVSR